VEIFMYRTLRRLMAVSALLCSTSALYARAVDAQTVSADREIARRVSVTVTLVSNLKSDRTAALIFRRPDAIPHDVILLSHASANGARLAAAILYLRQLRTLDGDVAQTDGMFRVAEDRMPRSVIRAIEPQAQAIVARLRRSKSREVPGLGHVPARDIYLLPQRP
jgi:hypothetical protein